MLKASANLMDATTKEDASKMVNSVAIYDQNGNLIRRAGDGGAQKLYGVMETHITQRMPTFWTMTTGSTPQGSRRSFIAEANRRQRQARHSKHSRLPPIRCKILTRRPNSSCF